MAKRFVLTTESSSQSWGKPIEVFKSVDDAIKSATEDFRKSFNLPGEHIIYVKKMPGEDGALVHVSFSAKSLEEPGMVGTDREIFEIPYYKGIKKTKEGNGEYISS